MIIYRFRCGKLVKSIATTCAKINSTILLTYVGLPWLYASVFSASLSLYTVCCSGEIIATG